MIATTGSLASVNPYRFSSEFEDMECELVYYNYRYLNMQIGQFVSRDPLGEIGLSRYLFVHNCPVLKLDYLGLIFDITYVKSTDFTGHGWLRLGGLVEVGPLWLPRSVGFYPLTTENLKEDYGKLFSFQDGDWRMLYGAQVDPAEVKVFYGAAIEEWETEIWAINRGNDGRFTGVSYPESDRMFWYGDYKYGCCKEATREKVLSCINDYLKENTHETYQFPFLQCRTRASDVMAACCLCTSVKKSSPSRGLIMGLSDLVNDKERFNTMLNRMNGSGGDNDGILRWR